MIQPPQGGLFSDRQDQEDSGRSMDEAGAGAEQGAGADAKEVGVAEEWAETPTESFAIAIDDYVVIGNIIFMDKSCYVWLGSNSDSPMFGSLDMAIPTRFNDSPLTKTLFCETEGMFDCEGVCQRLSKRFNIQCFISCNIALDDDLKFFEVEKKLIEMLSPHFGSP